MPISYLKGSKLFYLAGGDSCYIIKLYKDVYPMHLYWGKRISPEDISWFLEAPYRRKNMIESTYPDDAMFTKEFWPFEYPSYGTSDYRAPAFDLRDANGNLVCDARFKAYHITDGKPVIEGLPACYCESDEEAQTLELVLEDKRLGLELSLFYTIYHESGVLSRHTVFRNIGAQTITLRAALSTSIDMKQAPYAMLQMSGTALREHYIEKRLLENGDISIESTRGISSHQQNPFIALVDATTTETSGNAYGLALVYSGNFIARVGLDMYRSARVQIGINPFAFSWQLAPKDTFSTPEAVMVYSSCGLGGMSRKYHKLFRERLYRGYHRDRARPVVLNTWEAAYFDFNHDKIIQLAQKATQAGVEVLVLDDGWFGTRDDDKSSLGDWFVNTRKLPYGLDGLAQEVNNLGMKFGLWFEPEMISPVSRLYELHPDWCVYIDGCKRTQWRNQLVLDLSRDEVCDYIVAQMSEILNSANIEYVKWDCNRRITEPASNSLPPERQDEWMHRYVLGLYKMMNRLTSTYPNVLFENCASGGARMDAGMMAYFPQTWVSDNSDAVCRLKIQHGTSLCYPPIMTTAHISECPNHQILRDEPLAFRADVAFPYNLGYELNVCRMSERELSKMAEQVAKYKNIRDFVQFGEFYRLISPFEGPYTAWQVMDKNKSKVMVWFYKPIAEPEEAYINVKLLDLEENSIYICEETEASYSGGVLMQLGLPIQWKNGDYFSQSWTLKQKN